MTDKDAVGNVIERRGRHGYYGGNGILSQKLANAFGSKA